MVKAVLYTTALKTAPPPPLPDATLPSPSRLHKYSVFTVSVFRKKKQRPPVLLFTESGSKKTTTTRDPTSTTSSSVNKNLRGPAHPTPPFAQCYMVVKYKQEQSKKRNTESNRVGVTALDFCFVSLNHQWKRRILFLSR